jgi:hypothetical protein
MMWTWELDVGNRPDGRITKPREMLEWDKQLPVADEQPETVG